MRQWVRPRHIGVSLVTTDFLSRDRSTTDAVQLHGVVDRLVQRVILDRGPHQQRLVGHPGFLLGGQLPAVGQHDGGDVLQRGVHAVEGQPNVVAVTGDGAAVSTIGHVVIGGAGCGALVIHTVIHADGAAEQAAGAAVVGAAAAIGKAAGRTVPAAGGQIGMPVGHGDGGWIVFHVEVDLDGGRGIQLLNPFQTMPVGVACHQADRHVVIEAILPTRATFGLEARGATSGLLDNHIVEGGCTDGQGIGQGSRPGLHLAVGTDFQGGRGDPVAIAGAAQHGPLEIDRQCTGAGDVAQTAVDGLLVGRQGGPLLAGGGQIAPDRHLLAGMLWHDQTDAQVLFSIIGGQLHQVLELIVRAHDVVSGAAVQAGTVRAVEIGGAVEVRAVLHFRDGGTRRKGERGQGQSCQKAVQRAKRKGERRSAHHVSRVLAGKPAGVSAMETGVRLSCLGRKADRFMHEGYSARGRLPMENGPQSIGGNGHGTGGAELWCGCHIPPGSGVFPGSR